MSAEGEGSDDGGDDAAERQRQAEKAEAGRLRVVLDGRCEVFVFLADFDERPEQSWRETVHGVVGLKLPSLAQAIFGGAYRRRRFRTRPHPFRQRRRRPRPEDLRRHLGARGGGWAVPRGEGPRPLPPRAGGGCQAAAGCRGAGGRSMPTSRSSWSTCCWTGSRRRRRATPYAAPATIWSRCRCSGSNACRCARRTRPPAPSRVLRGRRIRPAAPR